jgi:hypothetical protein
MSSDDELRPLVNDEHGLFPILGEADDDNMMAIMASF